MKHQKHRGIKRWQARSTGCCTKHAQNSLRCRSFGPGCVTTIWAPWSCWHRVAAYLPAKKLESITAAAPQSGDEKAPGERLGTHVEHCIEINQRSTALNNRR